MRIKLAGLVVALVCFGNQDGRAQAPASPTLALPAFVAAQAASSERGSIAGDWNGELDVQGKKLRLVLHIKKHPDGTFAATIDSLDQGANAIPVSAAEQSDNDVKLELGGIAAGYQGKLNTAGTEITGEWKQGGNALPLIFKRAAEKGAGQKTPPGPPATLAGFEDQANFSLVVNEERLGSMQSTWKKTAALKATLPSAWPARKPR